MNDQGDDGNSLGKAVDAWNGAQANASAPKPVDRWLVVAAMIIAIAVGLPAIPTPRSPNLVIAFLIAIYLLAAHPLWNFWWVENRPIRRVIVFGGFAFVLGGYGLSLWPFPEPPKVHLTAVDPVRFVAAREAKDRYHAHISIGFLNDGDDFDYTLLGLARIRRAYLKPNVATKFHAEMADPDVLKQLRALADDELAKFHKDPDSFPLARPYTTLPSHEGFGTGYNGTEDLTKAEVDDVRNGKDFVYFLGYVITKNDSGLTFDKPFCEVADGTFYLICQKADSK